MLPAAGRVLVSVGDRVQPHQVVAEAPLAGQLVVVDIAQALHTDPEKAMRSICVQAGQQVTPDTVLASRWRGLRRVQARTPHSGEVAGIHEGCLFIQEHPQTLSLRAALPGQVVEVFPGRGVAIRSSGALLRGAWGVGGERAGMLLVPANSPDEPLTWQHVELAHRGAILVGGVLSDHRTLFRARQFRVGGLVFGSIHPNLRPLCERLALPVIVTEGMGRIPMASAIFEHLRRCRGRMALIAASPSATSGPWVEPELVIPFPLHPGSTAIALARPVQVGVRVRLTRPPYLGLVAEIAELPPMPQKTSAGALAQGARVRLPDGQRLFVPLVNLEVIG
jgi:hypothetical protein